MTTDDNEIQQKISKKYFCKCCDYTTQRKCNYDTHLLSSKHLNNNVLTTKISDFKQSLSDNTKIYNCPNCEKGFNDRAGLWRHKQKCNIKIQYIQQPHANLCDKDLIMMLINDNKEFRNILLEQCKEKDEYKNMMMKVLENGTHNTTHINSHNKAFNLQFFLNETCKDAMNIMDFVDSIKLQVTDLERVGEVGYVEGISDIIVSNLNKLDITQRPIHCTDKKRETMYVKDAGKWEKDESTTVIRRAIRKVTHNNQRLLPQFKEKYPDYHNSYSSHSDKVTKVIIETMVNNVPDKEEKIIRNIAKSVVLDKAHSL